MTLGDKRFFSPDAMIWQVDREMVLLLAGGRALLMQLAHPKVAAGVAEHSHFKADPLGRLYRTMARCGRLFSMRRRRLALRWNR